MDHELLDQERALLDIKSNKFALWVLHCDQPEVLVHNLAPLEIFVVEVDYNMALFGGILEELFFCNFNVLA